MSKLIERKNGTTQDEADIVRSVIELSRHAPRYGNFTFRASFKNHKLTTILELPLVRPVIPEHQEVTKPKTCGVARPGTEHFRCEVPDGHFKKQPLP